MFQPEAIMEDVTLSNSYPEYPISQWWPIDFFSSTGKVRPLNLGRLKFKLIVLVLGTLTRKVKKWRISGRLNTKYRLVMRLNSLRAGTNSSNGRCSSTWQQMDKSKELSSAEIEVTEQQRSGESCGSKSMPHTGMPIDRRILHTILSPTPMSATVSGERETVSVI